MIRGSIQTSRLTEGLTSMGIFSETKHFRLLPFETFLEVGGLKSHSFCYHRPVTNFSCYKKIMSGRDSGNIRASHSAVLGSNLNSRETFLLNV